MLDVYKLTERGKDILSMYPEIKQFAESDLSGIVINVINVETCGDCDIAEYYVDDPDFCHNDDYDRLFTFILERKDTGEEIAPFVICIDCLLNWHDIDKDSEFQFVSLLYNVSKHQKREETAAKLEDLILTMKGLK